TSRSSMAARLVRSRALRGLADVMRTGSKEAEEEETFPWTAEAKNSVSPPSCTLALLKSSSNSFESLGGIRGQYAATSSDTDDDSSSVQSSSADSMADVVVAGLQGNERDDSEADSDGGSQHEEDSLDDDESRSVDSDSTGSLADFIAPDWEMESGNEGEAAEDDDYENE
ncbi:hypothetical protein ARSEF4850_010136, partial [Beauveria asiatica]